MNNEIPLGQRSRDIQKEMDTLRSKEGHSDKWYKLWDEFQHILNTIVDRNLKGRELEKQDDVEEAIRLYEQNVTDEVDTPFPYQRLAIIYSKNHQYSDAVRVLDKAIPLMDQSNYKDKFIKRLAKIKTKS